MPASVGLPRNIRKRSLKEIAKSSASNENKSKNSQGTTQIQIEDLPTPFSSFKRSRKNVCSDQGKLKDVAQAAVKIYEELLERYNHEEEAIDRERRYDDDAQVLAESLMTARYDELCKLVECLMPWTGMQLTDFTDAEGRPWYRTAQFHGRHVPYKSKGKPSLETRLDYARKQGNAGLAMDALCATFAALSCRREMCWLDTHDEEKPPRGNFAHALVDPSSTVRLTFKIDSWRPASLLLTSVVPLHEALSRMDNGGPLQGFRGPLNQQFALQQVQKGLTLGDGFNEREPLFELKPDSQLQALLRSKTPVLMVEAYAALAPRDEVQKHGLGDIIKNEFMELLKQAKAQKQAVVFQLGGNAPHTLAEKVYLKPPFTNWGLRVGYLRWRLACCKDSKWAAERPIKDRSCIGLQMP